MGYAKFNIIGFVCFGLLAACNTPPVVTMPTTARSYPAMVMTGNDGAIFQAQTAIMLFEETLARSVGDVLTIEISESVESAANNNSAVSRKSNITDTGSADDSAPGIIRSIMGRNNFSGSSDSQFKGNGSFASKNGVTSTLAATVIDVLPNGNLRIGGEKRVSLNKQQSVLRLTGVINRKDIKTGNIVASKKIADARLELLGEGAITDANTMGWMQKLFLSVLAPY